MKKLLVITYYWPPSGGAAVQRWLSFANKLAEKQYDVHILTVAEKHATYQLRDESLVKEIHPNINVHTTKTREPFKGFTFLFGKKSMPKPAFANENNSSLLKKLNRFIRGNFFIPDPRKGWRPYAVKKAMELVRNHSISCIITAGPPHSTHFIGKHVKEQLDVVWIADFHDLWTDVIYYDMLYHLPVVKRADRKLERTILESCDHVITVGDKYKEKLLSKSTILSPEKISVLRIGYDEQLFWRMNQPALQESFVITYSGTIADFYEPEVFIAAFSAVVTQFSEVSFILRFAGVLSNGIKQKILEAGLGNILQDVGYLSHKEAVNLLGLSTVLLLVNPVTKDEAMVIPGKVYEYLASGRPIINITTSDAETADIIKECRSGKTFNRSEQQALTDYLIELILQWKDDCNLASNTDNQCVQHYSRKSITEHLIKVIEDSSPITGSM